jgi:hypothetical protein
MIPIKKLPHEVLPFEIEKKLPYEVIDNIYSFLRRNQSKKHAQIERLQISINHKYARLKELIEIRKKRRIEKEQKRKTILETLNTLEIILKRML